MQYLVLIISFFLSPILAANTSELSDSLTQLINKNNKAKSEAIENITQSNTPQTIKILESLLEGKLYYRKSDKTVFYFNQQDEDYHLEEILSGAKTVTQKKRDYRKITINNKLRRKLRQSIASLQLGNTDPSIRKAAVEEVFKKLTPENIALLNEYLPKENNVKIKTLIQLALTINELSSDDDNIALAAIEKLDGNIEPVVRNTLNQLVEETDNPIIKAAAQKSLKSIESQVKFYGHMETLYFGLSLGSVLALAGLGLAITFGVMGVINMAHGELIMIGAYTTYVIQLLMPDSIGMSIIVAIPAAFIVAGLVGILMERTVIRHLYGRPLETLLATFGISLILQQAVRSIFSPLNRTVITPEWMSGTLDINAIFSLTWNRLYVIVFCIMVFITLIMIMKKTPLGLQVRAVSQNRAMSRAMGVRSDWVDALTFGLGAGIAGVAGVALSLLTNVGPNLGQAYIIDSFMVVVFGGVGNLWGTLVAGMSLGVINKVLEPWAGAVLAKILVLIGIILFIQKRPRGLFPQRGRASEN